MNEVTKSAIQAMRNQGMTKEEFKKTVDGEVIGLIQWGLVPEK